MEKRKRSGVPDAKSMTRRQVKALRDGGLDPALSDDQDPAVLAKISVDMADWIMDNVYPECDFEDVSYAECYGLAKKTYRLTMGLDEETKNS